MKLRLDLLEHLTDEDILEEVLANNHRKPSPNSSANNFSGVMPGQSANSLHSHPPKTAGNQEKGKD